MSVQFGRWNTDGKPVDLDYLERVKAVIAPYCPDDTGCYSKDNVGILYQHFRTTQESQRDSQPLVTASGKILTWDGRLDNRADLVRELSDIVTTTATDVEIVAAAYDCGGSDCFRKLIGDWALSLWDPRARSLVLARDPIGPRQLYYSVDGMQVTWGTTLEPLVLLGEKPLALCGEYIAGWLSYFPAAHLTPYEGIHSVPPSSSVLLRRGAVTIHKYWDFDPDKRVRYRTDQEYEEHFRSAFREAVRRRLRSDSHILAELSGGMDSSSIVCMADSIIGEGAGDIPRLETVSYYNDSEPNWNERPYFMKVERKRGRTGCHIDIGSTSRASFTWNYTRFAPTPASGAITNPHFSNCIAAHGCRVVLSGVGGDEVMGGVPTPTPELQDLLARTQLRVLAHQLQAWALNKRRPWFHLLFEAIRGFFPAMLFGPWDHRRPAPWLARSFVRRNREALRGYERTAKPFGPLPSFQENLSTLDALRRQLTAAPLPAEPLFERRYPYLDRDLLVFLYAIPREQLVRPGQRRSLARRALVGIVPEEILTRKRKASVSRRPMMAISAEWPRLLEISRDMNCASLGFVDPKAFSETMDKARVGQEVPLVWLLRTVGLELWLRNVSKYRIPITSGRNSQSAPNDAALSLFSAEKS